MSRPSLEVADIFRGHGPAWRRANAGHVSLGQLKVMSAIESCRTAALGGHVARCEKCAHSQISYNSCRNRHCPKCQGAAAKDWLAAREADLLPVPYYHVVFTLPGPIADIAYQNKAVIYDLLFKTSAETLITIAADPKHLGARVGITSVLHTWGSAMTHHPHVHMIVPGGGISLDGERWVASRPGFFLPVRVLSRLFRRLFLEKLIAAHKAGHLTVLRRSCRSRRHAGVRGVSGTATANRMPSRWGCCHPHPSQTRTCQFPASGSSRESFARGGVKAVDDPRRWKRMALQDRVEAGPLERASAAMPSPQPFPPLHHDLAGEPSYASRVA